MDKSKKYQSNSLLRGLRILEAFGAGRAQMTLSQIADEISVTSSAAFRFVHTLEQEGYLIKNEAERTFRLAPRVMELGYSYIKSLDLNDVAASHARHLRDLSGFSVHVAVLENTDAVYVFRAMSPSPMVSNIPVGSRLPAFATSMGRIMLSSLSNEEIDRRFKGYEFQKFTDNTIGTLNELKVALKEDQKRGYIAQTSQLAEGTNAIAAPIHDRSGYAIGAVNISGHYNQLSLNDHLVNMVLDCAKRISEMQ
ncbi:IclR family transcriptional regulator [Kiloniella litopenaei]|uniref:IclR family transcriptional regulator n=1 Tax=Kiloniella litopenaei TaxID=1549748 RepID=UPI003BA9037B